MLIIKYIRKSYCLYRVIINDCTIVGGCALCFRSVRYALGAPLRPLVVTNIYNDPVQTLKRGNFAEFV
jgi:hypothetical protein